jgi:hypothetical protein
MVPEGAELHAAMARLEVDLLSASRDIAKELTVAAGSNYKVDDDSDDKLKIEGKNDITFSPTLAGQSVIGLSKTLK